MALIGKIRKNNWLLILVIGLALAAFIMMDSFGSDRSIGATSGTTVGNIAGTKISISEFDRMYQVRAKNFTNPDSYAQRNNLWNTLVSRFILKQEAEETGLGVSDEELRNLQFGPKNALSPLMAQRFPAAGNSNPFGPQEPDMARIAQFKNIIDTGDGMTQDFVDFWEMHEQEIETERIQAKLSNLVSKSMYTPSWMVEKGYADQNQRIAFNYVKIPFDEVDNSEVTIEDADLQSYLDANVAKFMLEEESRKIGYVSFDVVATAGDSLEIKNKLSTLGQQFLEAPNDSNFIQNNFGQFENLWLDAESVNPTIKDEAFSKEVGGITDAYLDGRDYKIAVVMDRRVLPDSAKCRHILVSDESFINAQRSNPNLKMSSGQYAFFKQRADSILNVLNEGGNFDTLALKHSADSGSKNNGGFYDWAPVNQYVPEFNDVVFFSGELNKLYIVKTSFGYHIIEPLGRKTTTDTERVRLAYLSENIKPSANTRNTVFTKATSFIQANNTLDKMKAAADADADVEYGTTNPVGTNDYSLANIGADEESRKIVKFAFNNDKGDVSDDVYTFRDPVYAFDNKFVVAAVESVQAAGKRQSTHTNSCVCV